MSRAKHHDWRHVGVPSELPKSRHDEIKAGIMNVVASVSVFRIVVFVVLESNP